MNALRKAARKLDVEVPRLQDYRVRIPPGGRSAALVETLITWKGTAGRRAASPPWVSTPISSPQP